jgi:Tfp pilus assembly protein PilP
MKRLLSSLSLAVALGTSALAQESPAPAAPADETAAPVTPDLGQLAVPEGGLIYSSQGRRDPFVSLIKPVGPQGQTGTRKAGIEGFLIQETALKGIIRSGPGQLIALLEGTDKKTYFVKVGQRLFDGQITAMDATTVTFRQEVEDPLAREKTRELKKSLYPTEEARQ